MKTVLDTLQREMELADTTLFPKLHKEIGKPGNRGSFKARTRGWYFSFSPPEELLISSHFTETQEGHAVNTHLLKQHKKERQQRLSLLWGSRRKEQLVSALKYC